ncbi:MAG: 2-phospho-L-lactate guanylyltransferase [Pseudomonadota bacterium]
MTRTLVAIPMKDPNAAKTRLMGVCAPAAREALVLHLLGQTIRRLRAAQDLGARFEIAIVTTSRRIHAVATADGLPTISDLDIGLSGAAASAKAWAEAQGFDALCILPGDIASPHADDLATLLARPNLDSVTLCPALDFGTNALVLPVKSEMAFAYGPGSFHTHQAKAVAAGLMPRILPLTSLRRDVDTQSDLTFLTADTRRVLRWTTPDANDRHAHGPV